MIYNKQITINETETIPRYNILDSHLQNPKQQKGCAERTRSH